jgi:hypothetical protein
MSSWPAPATGRDLVDARVVAVAELVLRRSVFDHPVLAAWGNGNVI